MAVLGVAGTRHLLALTLLCSSLLAVPARADDDEPDRDIAIGETKKGVYDNTITGSVWHFKGKAGQYVTLRFKGKRAKQIQLVMYDDDEDMSGEALNGSVDDSFAASGNVRDGDEVRVQFRLPKTANYHVHLGFDRNKKSAFGDGGNDLGYEIAIDGAAAPGKAYVRGTVAFMLGGTVGDDADITPYGANATLAVGQHRGNDFGVEGMLSASLLPADEFTLIGMLGIGARIKAKGAAMYARYAVGLSAMTGVNDGLGAGIRFDFQVKKLGIGMEGHRVGRTNVLLAMIGLAF